MKKQLQRWMLLTGVFCMASFGAYGCGGKETLPEDREQVESPAEESDGSEDAKADPADDTGKDEPKADPADQTDSLKTGKEDLAGDVREIGDGQFTVVEMVTEELEDGAGIMVGTAPGGDDSDFSHVTVTWDENTVFYIRTIYDNGARYEDQDASAEDLTEDTMVLVWGSWDEGHEAIHAEQIQMDEFVR